MGYCTKCGKQNLETARFCTTCGIPIAGLTTNPPLPLKNFSKRIPRKLWMTVSIIAFLGFGVLSYFLFIKKKSTDSVELQNSTSTQELIGLYPYTSQRLLTDTEVSNLSQSDLRIMRNEIYARHGFIFQSKEMANYFSSQSWYTPKYYNVTDRLSAIEKNNIAMIKSY